MRFACSAGLCRFFLAQIYSAEPWHGHAHSHDPRRPHWRRLRPPLRVHQRVPSSVAIPSSLRYPRALRTLTYSLAAAPSFIGYGGKILNNNFEGETGFTVKGGLKDVTHVRNLAQSVGATMPALDAVRTVRSLCLAEGKC